MLPQLKDLMDLRQKHANLSEARSARLQTEETSRQGNTIMVFTIVTILFVSILKFCYNLPHTNRFQLPASFMASFFALAINQFPRDSSSMLDLNYVVKYMCKLLSLVGCLWMFINAPK
jgi:hypothetical protein